MSKFKHTILEILLSITIGSVTILPFVIICKVLNIIGRFFVSTFLWLTYGDEIILNPSGNDGMFMNTWHKHGKRMILYMAINESPIDLESHRESYLNHIINLPSYQKLKKIFTTRMGYFCLKEDLNFDIKNHIKIYPGLESNPGRIITEKELMEEILPELSKDMEDESKPQWEDVIIPRFQYNLTDKDTSIKSVRVVRIHHSYMDGVSNILMMAYQQSEGKNFPWVLDPLKPMRNTTALKRFLYYTLCALKFSSTTLEHILFTGRYVKNRWIHWHFTGHTNYLWSNRVDMEVLKKIKAESGACMPAILCSLITSGVHRFEKKFESSNPLYKERMSDKLIVALVAALIPYPDLELRNRHSLLKCYFDSREMSRVERLRRINDEVTEVGGGTDVYLGYLIAQFFGSMPVWFSNLCACFMAGCGVVSNFPVSSRKVKFWGNEVNAMGGWVPILNPSGFGCVTLRYADSLRFCLNADSAAITKEQMTYLVETIVEEVDLLAKECVEYNKINKEVSKIKARGTDKLNNNNNNNSSGRSSRSNSADENDNDILRDLRLHRAFDKVIASVKKIKSS